MQIESISAVQAGYKISEALPASRPSASETHKSEETPDPAANARQDAEQSVRSVNEAIKGFDVSLKFSRDDETGKMVIEVIDQKSGQTLQQFPNEATLHLSAALGKLQGMVFNQKA
jgi:flagellar protein FlaG